MILPGHPQTEQARARERWDNEGGHTTAQTPADPDALEVQLQQYGIGPVHLTVYDWGGYRYSHPCDALAAAKRATR